MVMIPLFLLTFSTVVFGRYMPNPGPTVPGHQSTSISPAATSPAALLPRDDPPLPLTNSQTCGYTRGLWSSAVTCPEQFTCNYYTEPYSAPNFGCCSSEVGCEYISACYDYGDANNPNTAGQVLINGGDSEFYCGSNQPYCSTLILYGQEYTSGGTYSFLSYACRTGSPRTVTAFQTTTQESSSTTESHTSTTASSSETSSTTTSSSTPAPASSTASAATPPADSADQQPLTDRPTAGLSQGALIGIGVGVGIAAAGALVAIWLWLWRRRKERTAEKQANVYYPRYGDGGSGFEGSPSGGGGGGGEYYAPMQKQAFQNPMPVELHNEAVRHELDGGKGQGQEQEAPLVGRNGNREQRGNL